MNIKSNHSTLLLVLLLGLSLAWPEVSVSADLYNNLSESSNGNRTIVHQAVESATSFKTTALDSVINSITVNIAAYYPTPVGNIELSIYAADGTGGIPGTIIAPSIVTIDVPGLFPGIYTVSDLNVPLSPSTLYWLVLSGPTTSGGIAWYFTNSSNGAPDSLGSTERVSGIWGSIIPTYPMARIEASGLPPVPIPTLSEWAQILLALSLMCMAGWYWQRRES